MSKDIVINFDKLEKEFHNAVLADEKYSRENDAKFRAIEQRVGTYEDFRQIVLASNLKPLEKGETLRSMPIKNTWNLAADKNNGKENDETKKLNHEVSSLSETIPKSNLEFTQIWRKIGDCQKKQWDFIKNIGADKLIDLFMSEINGDMLGKFFKVFFCQIEETQKKDDCDLIVNLLNGFPICNRFELNYLFLQKKEIELCKIVFEKLTAFYDNNKNETNIDLCLLKSKYFK